MLVGFDVTIAARSATGVGVYAPEPGAALENGSCTLRVWPRSLGRSGHLYRPLNAMRLRPGFRWSSRAESEGKGRTLPIRGTSE
jgi:hypothetical protein